MKKQDNMVDIFDISESGVYKDRILEFKDLESPPEKIGSFFDQVTKKIERLQTKAALYKMKQVMIEEESKSYYRNSFHIQEMIDIDSYTDEDERGQNYHHVEKLIIWSNGYYNFNSYDHTIFKLGMDTSNSQQEKLKRR